MLRYHQYRCMQSRWYLRKESRYKGGNGKIFSLSTSYNGSLQLYINKEIRVDYNYNDKFQALPVWVRVLVRQQ